MTARPLRISAVIDRVALSRRTLLSLVDAGKFPEPVHPSPRTVAWLESKVDGWIDARIAERDEQRAG